jgi:predicted dehydrogenase
MNLKIKPLRFGIVGLGFGAKIHAPVLLSISDVEVVGIVGRSGHKAKAIANKLGIAKGFDSIDQLIDQGVDAVTIAVPPREVISIVDKVLMHRVPVLCEKPFGTDYVTSMAMLKKHNVDFTTSMSFIFAELDVFIRLKEIIQEGRMGKVKNAKMIWLYDSWSHRSKTWSWKTDADQHGGVLSLLGSHIFFFAEWLFGSVKTVNANCCNDATSAFAPIGASAAEDYANCVFSYSSGTKLSCTFGIANSDTTIHRWIVEFDYGIIILENKSKNHIDFCMKILKKNEKVEYLKEKKLFMKNLNNSDERLKPFYRIARRFINAVREGFLMQPDLSMGARVQLLDNAIRNSIKTKKKIYL